MLYFIPDFQVMSDLSKQNKCQNKLGGTPWGVPTSKWPKCEQCQRSQALIAQFLHHPQVLDLGKEGRVLNVFMCEHDPESYDEDPCETYDPAFGGSACFILEPEELEDHLSNIPKDTPYSLEELPIIGWFAGEDGISAAEANAFYTDQYFDLDQEKLSEVTPNTRLGGVPFWLQSPLEAPKNYRFVGQLDSYCGANFGDTGIGYIFLEELSKGNEAVPKGHFFWQCS